jgi:hypothetical protein
MPLWRASIPKPLFANTLYSTYPLAIKHGNGESQFIDYFQMLTSFGDLLLDECRIILSTWCAPWWCGEMLSWARFSAQFLHVQYVLSCVDFIKDVQPKDIRNLISSDEMHSQAGDTELVLWCFVEDSTGSPFEGETSHFGAGVGHDACSLGATAAVHEGTRCDELDGSGSKFHTQGTRTCWFDT